MVTGIEGKVAGDDFFAHFILSRIERKYLQFFYAEPIFTEIEQDLAPLAHYE
jgi:hypothetical protein